MVGALILADRPVAGAPVPEPGLVGGAQGAAGDGAVVGGGDVRIEPAGLNPGGPAAEPAVRGVGQPDRVEQRVPALLEGAVLVEARLERVPGHHRHDRVHASVDPGGGELDPAAIAPAGHPHARIADPVELHLWDSSPRDR